MYISLTGNSDNKDVYIKRSYRKSNGKTATQIHRKLGILNELLGQFSGDYDGMDKIGSGKRYHGIQRQSR